MGKKKEQPIDVFEAGILKVDEDEPHRKRVLMEVLDDEEDNPSMERLQSLAMAVVPMSVWEATCKLGKAMSSIGDEGGFRMLNTQHSLPVLLELEACLKKSAGPLRKRNFQQAFAELFPILYVFVEENHWMNDNEDHEWTQKLITKFQNQWIKLLAEPADAWGVDENTKAACKTKLQEWVDMVTSIDYKLKIPRL